MMNPQSRVQEYMVEHIDLIPGMPDDVAVDCLARVPHGSFRSMRRVCRGWKSAAAAPDFALARAEAGANEDLVFLLQFGNPAAGNDSPMDGDAPENSPAYGVAVYNVTTGEWHRERAAPPMPMFAQCAAVGTRLAVMGGWDPKTFEPVADVHVLDAATGVWRRGTPMRSARSFFACAEAGGKIYVAGGHDKLKNALKTAEAYDAEADGWDPLPDMSEERDECDGMLGRERLPHGAPGRVRARRGVVRPGDPRVAPSGARPRPAVGGARGGARPRVVHRGHGCDGVARRAPRLDRGGTLPAGAQGRHGASGRRQRRRAGGGHRRHRVRRARGLGVRRQVEELDRGAAAAGVRRLRLLRGFRPRVMLPFPTVHLHALPDREDYC